MTGESPKPAGLSMASDPPSSRVMRRFWARMAAIYGHKWTSSYGERCDDDEGALTLVGDTWARGLSGISDQAIARGVNGCLMSSDPWPPSLPLFRASCLAIPSLAMVRLAIAGKVDQTPFSRLVAGNLDTYRMRQVDAEKADRMVRDAYELAREHAMCGGDLPPEPAAFIENEKPEHKPAPPEVAKRHLEEIAKAIGIRDNDDTPPEAA